MKKLFVFSILTMFITCAVNAATKCIAMGTESTCTSETIDNGQTDWGAVCGDVSIHGVAVCGSWSEGRDLNGVLHKKSVRFDSNTAGNTSCFCKIVQPVVSRWVFAEEFFDEGGQTSGYRCTQYCAATCAGKLGNKSANAEFFNAVMGELYE